MATADTLPNDPSGPIDASAREATLNDAATSRVPGTGISSSGADGEPYNATAAVATTALASGEGDEDTVGAPQMTLDEDGNIVINQSSLVEAPSDTGLRRSRRISGRKRTSSSDSDVEAERARADLDSMTVGQIISTMRTRGRAAPSPSSVARRQERKRRRAAEGEQGDTPMPATAVVVPVSEEAEEEDEAVLAPQMTLDEDGNIVVDQASLVVTARGGGGDARRSARVTMVENVARGAHITSGSFMRREKGTKWEHKDTESFYAALSVFGTDFSLMMRVFPERSRRQLKLKFKREEREHPLRIDAAMRRRPALDTGGAGAADRAAAVEQLLRPVESTSGADGADGNSSGDELRNEVASAMVEEQSSGSVSVQVERPVDIQSV